MPAPGPTQTVGELVVERPARARVFERLGIDYCCGGRHTLDEACAHAGVSVEDALGALAREDERSAGAPAGEDWSSRSLTDLADHIESAHHAYLREELPRLTGLLENAARAHGERDVRFLTMDDLFGPFRAELEHHMVKEERMLFPAIRALEAEGSLPARFPFTTLANPIRIMHDEHDHAGDALARLRELTDGFTPTADACNTVRALYDGLATLERDLHQHVHKENNILFPRAMALEASVA